MQRYRVCPKLRLHRAWHRATRGKKTRHVCVVYHGVALRVEELVSRLRSSPLYSNIIRDYF